MIIKYSQFINESKNDPIPELNQNKIGIILMGTPGLGKSYFNKNYIQTRKQIKTFSTDDVSLKFTKDPNKYYGGASDLNIKMLLTFMDSGNSFVYDTTGTHPDQIFKIVQKARKSDYKIIFIHLVGPLELSLKQNQIRDRQVDPEYIKFSYQNQFPNMRIYSKQLDPDAYYIVYNKDNKYKFFKYKDGEILKRKVDKYIKEQVDTDLYNEITNNTELPLSVRSKSKVDFTDQEVNEIKSIFKYCKVRIGQSVCKDVIPDNHILEIDKAPFKIWHKDFIKYSFRIKKYDDEWFVVKKLPTVLDSNDDEYLCDTIEGVIKLLLNYK